MDDTVGTDDDVDDDDILAVNYNYKDNDDRWAQMALEMMKYTNHEH